MEGDEGSGSDGDAAGKPRENPGEPSSQGDPGETGRKIRAARSQLVTSMANLVELNRSRQASSAKKAYAVAVVGNTNNEPSTVFLRGDFPNAGVHPPRAASSRSNLERLQAGSPHLPAFEDAVAYNCDLVAGRSVTAPAAVPEGAAGGRSYAGLWAYLPPVAPDAGVGGAAAMPPEDAANAHLRAQVNEQAKLLAAKNALLATQEARLATQAAQLAAKDEQLAAQAADPSREGVSARADGSALLTPTPAEERAGGGFSFHGSSSMPQRGRGGRGRF